MIYVLLFLSITVVLLLSYLLIAVEKRKLEYSNKNYLKALDAYRSGNFCKTFQFLKKSLIVPSNNIINKEESVMNVKVLHLVDLVLLHQNIDGEMLTGELRRFLNDVHGIVNVDKKYFDPIKGVLKNAHQVEHLNQEKLKSILFEKGTNEISSEMLRDWRLGFRTLKIAKM